MTVFEIRDALGLVPLHEAEDRPVTGGYAGDLLSWVMGRAQSGDCWITIMSNRNVPAVCSLTDVAMVVFAEDVANAMKGGPIPHNRGVSQDPFWVLWRTTMPAVLVEVGFMTNANDLKALRSPEDRDKIAENLLKAIKTFKKRYDNSMSTSSAPESATKPEAAPETKPAARPDPKPETEKVSEPSGVVYGVQVLATSKKMKPTDAFFKGYTPVEVRSGKLYKYILVAGDDLGAVRKKKKELDKKFPGCFLVSMDGETVTRIP